MLAAACAVGVACTFAAPIGGIFIWIIIVSQYILQNKGKYDKMVNISKNDK